MASGVAAGVGREKSGVFVVTDAVTDGVGVGVQAASDGIRDVGRLTKSTVGGLGGLAILASRFGARANGTSIGTRRYPRRHHRPVLTEREAVETKNA